MAANGEQDSNRGTYGKGRCTCSCWVWITVVAIVILIDLPLTLVIVAPLGVKARENKVRCANVSAPLTGYTRSGSVARLGIIHHFDRECIKTAVSAHINDQGSVAVYQAPCNTLNTNKFAVNRSSLTYDNVNDPLVVLSEDFDDNYFLNGTVQVHINATFNSSISTQIYVCLFLNLNGFNNFTNLDKNWRDYVDQADCRVTTKERSNATFDIKSPNFIFIALAPTERLTTLQFGYNGTAQNYGQPTDNMKKVCSLSSDKASESQCSFSMDNNSTDLCVLASTADNADGSIDYISITLTFTQNTGKMLFFIVLAVLIPIIVFAVIVAFVIILMVTKRLHAIVSRIKSWTRYHDYQEIQ